MSFFAVLIASLLGSAHCVGMCGGIIACCIGQSELSSRLTQVLYHLGRLFTYLILGALAGYLGQTVDHWGDLLGIQRIAAIGSGILLIASGVIKLLRSNTRLGPNKFSALTTGSKFLTTLYALVFRSAKLPNWGLRAFLIGALSTLLPCGWLYSFVAVAAGSSSAFNGTLIMLAFWLGTVPALSFFGSVTGVLTGRAQRYIPSVTATLLIVAGLFALSTRMPGTVHHHSHHHVHHVTQG